MKASVLAAICLLAACAPPAAQLLPSAEPSASSPPATSPAASPAEPSHVFVIVMENRSYAQALAGGYIAKLAAAYPIATNYHGVSHPSLPNYLALTSGSTWGIGDDGYHRLPAGGLGAQLTAAAIDWRAYMEGMTAGCLDSPYPYALKHNPFAYYGTRCPPQVVSFMHFATDIKGVVPRLVWITPGLCHDGHDCSTTVADQWLSQVVPEILASTAWQRDGVLFITWDEGEDSGNHVLTLVIHPNAVAHTSARSYNHYSLLASIEDRLGVPRLGQAARARPMADLLASTPGA